HIEKTYRRPVLDRAIRAVLAAVLPYPARFRAALGLARLGRPFAPLAARVPALKPLAAMLALAPRALPGPAAPVERPAAPVGRVAILAGCAQSVLDPAINAATARLLARLG